MRYPLSARARPMTALAAVLAAVAGHAAALQTGSGIVADGSLHTLVSHNGNAYTISGGLLVPGKNAPGNLFESFSGFVLAGGGTATWTYVDPPTGGIGNVISRVICCSTAQIDGELMLGSGILPTASFFFIDPAGIVFGKGFSTNIPGSVYFSTAKQLKFSDGPVFQTYTTTGSTFSVAAPSAFGFLGGAGQGAISLETGAGLTTPSRLFLAAGDLAFSGGTISAGGLDLVAVGSQARDVSLGDPLAGAPFGGAITVAGSTLFTTASGSSAEGPIRLGAGALTVESGGTISSGTAGALNAGDITIDASSLMVDGGGINADSNGSGQGGTIVVNADTITVRDSGVISSNALADGNAGEIDVNPGAATLAGSILLETNGQFQTFAESRGYAANAGVMTFNVGDLTIDSGGAIADKVEGSGFGGRVTVHADNILVDGAGEQGSNFSRIGSNSTCTSSCHGGGSVAINARGVVQILNGGFIGTNSYVSDAGATTITASSIVVDGADVAEGKPRYSQISSANQGCVVNPCVDDGREHAGAVTLIVPSGGVTVSNGGFIGSSSLIGAAGETVIDAANVTVTGAVTLANGTVMPSRITSAQQPGELTGSSDVTGAGTIKITTTGDIVVSDGGEISTAASAPAGAHAGDIMLSADGVVVSGGTITSQTSGAGPGGAVSIGASTITVDPGGSIQADTSGAGTAGDIILTAPDIILLSGGAITSDTFGSGGAGNVTLTATHQLLVDGGLISVNANDRAASASAGMITIDTGVLTVQSLGAITSNTFGGGNAGNIVIRAGDVSVLAAGGGSTVNCVATGSCIASETFGHGDAGAVSIEATGTIVIDNSTITVAAGGGSKGNGGELTLRADTLTIQNGGEIAANTFAQGKGGDVTVNARTLTVQDGGRIEARTQGSGRAGDITLTAADITVRSGGVVTSDTSGKGAAGAVTLTAVDQLLLDQGRVSVSARPGSAGRGGQLTLATGALILRDAGSIASNTSGSGDAGDIAVTANSMLIDGAGSEISSANRGGMGKAGAITLVTGPITLSDGGSINTDAEVGPAGNISLTVTGGALLTLEGPAGAPGQITTSSKDNTGGHITITGPSAIVMNGGSIQALGPESDAFALIQSGPIIESTDRFNQIQVAGTLDLNSEIVDVSDAVTQSDVTFDDASKVLRGQCPVLRARGETSLFSSRLNGPYGTAPIVAPRARPTSAPAVAPVPARVASACGVDSGTS